MSSFDGADMMLDEQDARLDALRKENARLAAALKLETDRADIATMADKSDSEHWRQKLKDKRNRGMWAWWAAFFIGLALGIALAYQWLLI